MASETFPAEGRITSDMEYSAPVALGGWRERIKRLSVPYARLSDNELVERTQAGDERPGRRDDPARVLQRPARPALRGGPHLRGDRRGLRHNRPGPEKPPLPR